MIPALAGMIGTIFELSLAGLVWGIRGPITLGPKCGLCHADIDARHSPSPPTLGSKAWPSRLWNSRGTFVTPKSDFEVLPRGQNPDTSFGVGLQVAWP